MTEPNNFGVDLGEKDSRSVTITFIKVLPVLIEVDESVYTLLVRRGQEGNTWYSAMCDELPGFMMTWSDLYEMLEDAPDTIRKFLNASRGV